MNKRIKQIHFISETLRCVRPPEVWTQEKFTASALLLLHVVLGTLSQNCSSLVV